MSRKCHLDYCNIKDSYLSRDLLDILIVILSKLLLSSVKLVLGKCEKDMNNTEMGRDVRNI